MPRARQLDTPADTRLGWGGELGSHVETVFQSPFHHQSAGTVQCNKKHNSFNRLRKDDESVFRRHLAALNSG